MTAGYIDRVELTPRQEGVFRNFFVDEADRFKNRYSRCRAAIKTGYEVGQYDHAVQTRGAVAGSEAQVQLYAKTVRALEQQLSELKAERNTFAEANTRLQNELGAAENVIFELEQTISELVEQAHEAPEARVVVQIENLTVNVVAAP